MIADVITNGVTQESVFIYLISQAPPLDTPDGQGNTALHLAAKSGSVLMVKVCLDNQSQPKRFGFHPTPTLPCHRP